MPRTHRHSCFIVTALGLEEVIATELAGLGVRATKRVGGAGASLTTRQLYAANVGLRTATRILVRVGERGTRAATFGALREAIGAVDWSRWLGPDEPVDIRAASTGSRLFHTGAIVERVHEELGRPVDPSGRRLLVRLQHDELTISVDSSGEPLHKRGWRQQIAKAPLRETMAAAMVLASGWDRHRPLADPLCGSGTIAIEAALLARDRAPGLDRTFAFQQWPSFEPGTWASVRGEALGRVRPSTATHIVARDRDAGAIEATAANAARAGVLDDLDLAVAPLSDLPEALVDQPEGWILTNPPYGRRVRGGPDRRDLFARLGQVASSAGPGWHLGLLADDEAVARHTGRTLVTAWRSSNGGIPVRFLIDAAAPHVSVTGELGDRDVRGLGA